LSTLEQSAHVPGPDNALGPAPLIVRDRYRALAVTATSREAIVYAATDLVTGAPVTLEVLRPEMAADDEFMSAVREQVHRLAKPECEHAALVKIHEWGATDAGQMFIVLEPVAGASLRDTLEEQGAFDLQRALRLGMQIGEALETLHRCGIVHGELRPESVVLVQDEAGAESVKLIGVELTSARRTGSGVRLRDRSVVPYLAPEQLQHGETSEAADVHALGLLIQELLTAQRPRANGPQRPAGDFPAATGRILSKALATAPGRRYANVSLMVNDMWTADAAAQRTLPGTSAATPASVERRAGAGRRARSDVGMVAGLAAALLMLGVTAWVVHSDLLGGRLGAAGPEPAKAASPSAAASQPAPPTASTPAASATAPSLPPPPPVGAAVAPVPPPLKIVTPPPSIVAPVPSVVTPPPSVVTPPPPPAPVVTVSPPAPPSRATAPPPALPPPVLKPAPRPVQDSAPASPPAGVAAQPRQPRRVEPQDASSRAAGDEPRVPESGDGSAIIDWLLKDGRSGG
jgi:serine/threonine-protein kinase